MSNFYRPEHKGHLYIWNVLPMGKVKDRRRNYKIVLYENSRKPIPVTSEENG